MERAFDIVRLLARRSSSGEPWLEFFRVPSMSLGIYVLARGADDPQEPHTEDEIYYILSGRAQLRVGDDDREALPGRLLFVPAGAVHCFHGITEELRVLVLFAPAEGTVRPPRTRRPAGSGRRRSADRRRARASPA